MWLQRDLASAFLLSAGFALIIGVAEAWARLGNGKPEWTRKLVHLAGGCVCLAFPFAIRSWEVVLVMSVLMSGIFAAGTQFGILRSLCRVKRPTHGTVYYPPAIFMAYVLAYGKPWLYVSAVLTLAVADSLAALVGTHFGRLKFEIGESYKSVEGSLVFLAAAFVVIVTPLLTMSDLPATVSVLSALLVSLLLTGFEIVSVRGSDNLFVPIAACVILSKITTKPVPEILYQNASLGAFYLLISLVARRTRSFNAGGTIALVLYIYAGWSLGSRQWAIPGLFGFAAYAVCRVWTGRLGASGPTIRVGLVTAAVIVPFGILVQGNMTGRPESVFGPFLAATGTVVALCLLRCAARSWTYRGAKLAAAKAICGLVGWIVTALPLVLLGCDVAGANLLCTALVCVAAALLSTRPQGEVAGVTHVRWTAREFLLTCCAAATTGLLQALGYVPQWSLS